MKRGARAAAHLGRIAKSVFSDWESAIVKLSDGVSYGFADRMSREALLCVGGIPEEAWDSLGAFGDADFRECLDAPTAEAIDEIEEKTGLAVKFHEADVGRGASGLGVAVEVVAGIAVAGGATAAVGQSARFVKWAYHRIASARGGRPMISLGAAEHLAIADLIDRVNSTPHLIGSGDVCSHSQDRAFTGGDAFFVVLGTETELHTYHVSAYGELSHVGTSPLIRGQWDAPPPYWAGGDAAEN